MQTFTGLVVEYQTRNREVAGSTHTRSTASNLEQVASCSGQLSLLPSVGRKWVVAMATGCRPSRLSGAMVCLLATPWVQLSVSVGNGWPQNALRHHWLMPISCHFWDCKALLVTSLTHVSDAITFPFTFTFETERQQNSPYVTFQRHWFYRKSNFGLLHWLGYEL